MKNGVSPRILAACLTGLSVVALVLLFMPLFLPVARAPLLVFGSIAVVMVLSIMCTDEQHPLLGDVVCSLTIIVAIIANVFGILWFCCGTTVLSSPFDLNLFLALVRPAFVLLFLACYVYVIVRFYKRAPHVREMVVRIGLLAAILLVYKLGPYIHQNSRILFLKGLSKTVNKQIDISAMQDWLSQQEVPPDRPDQNRTPYYLKGVGSVKVGTEQQPEYVRKFSKGKVIHVLYDWEKKEFYTIHAGFFPWIFKRTLFEWQLVIGQPSKQAPASEEGYYGRKVLQLQPGAYVWCGFK